MSEYPIYSSVFAPLQKQIDFVTDAVKKGIAKVEDNPARIRRLDIRLAVGTDTVKKSGNTMISRKKNKRCAEIIIEIYTRIYLQNHCGRFRKAIKHTLSLAPKNLFDSLEISLDIYETVHSKGYGLKNRCKPLDEKIAQEYFRN
ncbi:hypothetical protein HOE22_12415 [Candidatus Woesearchaeota archaeon]|jgi:hypothetical protein|nr:hypothetical protein [Candidatus Woesearchaeota archaeon]MBT4732001.1 hypothetical protein [Candidatus Woesearchaeota archaeon]